MLRFFIVMQFDNNKKIPTTVEIADVPPPAYNETEEEIVSESAGTTQLSKEELYHLFNNRNLAFVSTLSKDGSPHVTPVWTEMADGLILINTFETAVVLPALVGFLALDLTMLIVAITQICNNFGYPHRLHFSALYYFCCAIY